MKKIIPLLTSELSRIILGAVLFILAIILDRPFPTTALVLYIIALIIAGMPVFFGAVRGILRRDLLDEKFLMSIASVGAMILGEYSEGVAVMLFFLVGEYFEHKAVAKSRKSIRALMDIRADEACVLTESGEEVIDADEVEIASIIVIRAGERVPIDCVITEGSADVDTSALTGEALPRSVSQGDTLDSGVVVQNGVLYAKTLRVADESAAARVLDLVENANERKAKSESFITRFSHFYTPTVVSLAILIAIAPPIFQLTTIGESLYRALIFLVISCPCALVISVPMAFFGGIGGAASVGILFKGGNVFSSLAVADSFAFDKTGTLTSGDFSVSEVRPYRIEKEELILLAASAEHGSNHPIARALEALSEKICEPKDVREIAGRGVFARVLSSEILVGNSALLEENGVFIPEEEKQFGAVFVAKNSSYVGSFLITDKVKEEAAKTVFELSKSGVKRIAMLSGDIRKNAENVGKSVGISEIYSELLPENKFEKLENIINLSKKTVYVGDGINDAPAIALADVGIAMGGIGSDSAIESADVVIMSDNLAKIPVARHIAKKTVRIASQNIAFALSVKGAILLLGALGFANLWLAVFADVGVAALAILNSMRCLKVMGNA